MALLVAAILAVFTCGHAFIGSELADAFHEGEYLATRQLFGAGAAPLLIHGYMDYVPALIAEAVFGSSRLIAGTRLLNIIFGSLAGFAFLGCLLQLARGRSEMSGALLIGGVLLFSIHLSVGDVIGLHQSSPAIRDVFLLFELWYLTASRPLDRRTDIFGAAAGLVSALGWFWAYNRGIAGIAALVAYGSLTLFVTRRWRPACWLGAGFAVGILACFAAEPAMFAQHVANMLYWQRNGDIWHIALSPMEVGRSAPLVLAGGAILALGAITLWRCSMDPERRHLAPRIGALLVAALLTYIAAFNRADVPHLIFFVPWMVLLAFACWCALTPEPPLSSWRTILRERFALHAALVGLLILNFSTSAHGTRAATLGIARNVLALIRGLPRDEEIAQDRLQLAANALRAGGSRCTYVFDSSAVLYHLSGFRPCSSIMIPHYIADENELRVIADLEAANPLLVIGRSNLPNNWLDGVSIAQRLPRLNHWLMRNYRFYRSVDGIEIWKKMG